MDIILKNYMEDMVDTALAAALKKQNPDGLCTCPECMLRMKMTALNLLPAFYVTTKSGEVFGAYRQKEQQYDTDIRIAVTSAIEQLAAEGPHREAPEA